MPRARECVKGDVCRGRNGRVGGEIQIKKLRGSTGHKSHRASTFINKIVPHGVCMALSPLEVDGRVGWELVGDILNNPASELSVRLEFLGRVIPCFEESINSVCGVGNNEESRCVEGGLLRVKTRAVC